MCFTPSLQKFFFLLLFFHVGFEAVSVGLADDGLYLHFEDRLLSMDQRGRKNWLSKKRTGIQEMKEEGGVSRGWDGKVKEERGWA